MSQTKKIVELCGKTFVLIGTAHVSKESVDDVVRGIREEMPDCVAIELDEERLSSLDDENGWKDIDIVKVLKDGNGFLLLANLIMASFQRRMGAPSGTRPGDEMRAGIRTASEMGVPSVMVDRPIKTTLRRAWATAPAGSRMKLLAVLLSSAFDTNEVSTGEIEALKNSSEMDNMMGEVSEALPSVKKVLIDERDEYLAAKIWESVSGENGSRNKVVAVLGAGHLPGVERRLFEIAGGCSTDVSGLCSVPEKKRSARVAKWLVPALIVALIVSGFFIGGKKAGIDSIVKWFVCNGVLAGVGAVAALAHPLAILISVVGAPFTSLCPFIGVGMLSGAAQAFFCKPKVADMEAVLDDVSSVRGFYKNRLLRVLLVFFLSSLGSSVGTFVAGSQFVVGITQAVSGLFS